ncbi:hypothetical protein I6A84_07385 [Frankia sp. CNm7]|uniref:Uncharacterized protein n=1 Tax=Frankia nepalensis TaxID=1836974 RepID=A0A937UQB3_9ACTN|nr:hypothetical protein [Frankia nepalensis]MBL7499604.1 hypothetical protein [Frankia nepalensis]MBL7515723.1 hypothetical protein [Frankia nepalensis]MBL7517948.1 hypothetical protein [Frankia nepalensis]MBL7626491.1 hypothetical protein [Frankia nepalensis]
MYGWIYRHLPGPTPVRVLLSALMIAVVAALLLFVVFPAVDPWVPVNDVTIG